MVWLKYTQCEQVHHTHLRTLSHLTLMHTHIVGGDCTSQKHWAQNILWAVKNTYLAHNFTRPSCHRHKHTPSRLCFIRNLGHQGWLVIRCVLVETCETNLLIALCLSVCHCLSLTPHLRLSPPDIMCLFPKQDGSFTLASCCCFAMLSDIQKDEEDMYVILWCFSLTKSRVYVYSVLCNKRIVKLSKFNVWFEVI